MEKTPTIGLIRKKATLHSSTLFLYISLLLFCKTATWNFQKLPRYTFYGGNVGRVLVHFFFSFTVAHFHPGGRLHPAATKFNVVTPKKKCLLLIFLSRSNSLSRWASLACRPLFSFFFFCLSPSLYSKFVDMTINQCLILKTTRIKKHFPLSVIVFIHSLVVSAS